METIEFTRITNNASGAPRYVCHFLNLNTREELDSATLDVSQKYNLALARAKQFKGKKYHNKSYGGGIAFASYDIETLTMKIHHVLTFA